VPLFIFFSLIISEDLFVQKRGEIDARLQALPFAGHHRRLRLQLLPSLPSSSLQLTGSLLLQVCLVRGKK
jgi:hypothetical protein